MWRLTLINFKLFLYFQFKLFTIYLLFTLLIPFLSLFPLHNKLMTLFNFLFTQIIIFKYPIRIILPWNLRIPKKQNIFPQLILYILPLLLTIMLLIPIKSTLPRLIQSTRLLIHLNHFLNPFLAIRPFQ